MPLEKLTKFKQVLLVITIVFFPQLYSKFERAEQFLIFEVILHVFLKILSKSWFSAFFSKTVSYLHK